MGHGSPADSCRKHYLTESLKAISPTAIDVTLAWFVRLSVCMSFVTFIHPAKAVGRHLAGTLVTRAVPSNSVLHRGPDFPREGPGYLGSRNHQFTAIPPIAELIWSLLWIVEQVVVP